jgi:mercuric reductase
LDIPLILQRERKFEINLKPELNMKVDLAIIGGGGAGFAAAAKANELGVKAVLINKGLPTGGTCVNVGCVPSKFLLEASFELWNPSHPRFNSISAIPSDLKFGDLINEKEDVVFRNRKNKYKDILPQYKTVTYIEERARMEGPNLVRAGNDLIETKNILICTGSSNRRLKIPGIETLAEDDVLDNITAFKLKSLPRSMIVIGGGYTGLEVAQMFSHFGTKIIQLEAKDRILSNMEPEVSLTAGEMLNKSGIDLYTGVRVKKIKKEANQIVVTVDMAGDERDFHAEKIFLAVGVKGNTEDLNLSAVGLETDHNGFIEVDDRMRTKTQGIYAAGDVAGPPLLETVAAREAAIAVETAFNGGSMDINYDVIPTAIFTNPQIASVGLTEAELMKRINICDCRTVELKYVPKADITNETLGVSKMVIDPRTGKIVGYHLISPNAAEIIHEATMAIKFGATIDDITDMIHVFPTFSEVMKITAQAFKRDIKAMSCCVE